MLLETEFSSYTSSVSLCSLFFSLFVIFMCNLVGFVPSRF